VIRDRRTFGRSSWPFTLARSEALDHDPKLYAGTHRGLARALVLPWNEKYTEAHVAHLAKAVRESALALRRR
jgi:hypothetical protein